MGVEGEQATVSPTPSRGPGMKELPTNSRSGSLMGLVL